MNEKMAQPLTVTTGNGNIVSQLGVTLPENVLEKVYESYSLKQKRAGLKCFLIASLLFDMWALFTSQGQSWEYISKFIIVILKFRQRFTNVYFAAILSIFYIANILLGLFLRICNTSKFHSIKVATWEIAPHAAWLIAIKQLALELILRGTVTPR